MKVLIIGGSGFIGKRLVETLSASGRFELISASRTSNNNACDILDGVKYISVDILNINDVVRALQGVDAVISCVAGDANVISIGARILVDAAITVACKRIIHLSSMAVYGDFQGVAIEDTPIVSGFGWYADAKCQAEHEIRRFVQNGGDAIVLRPGCVYGPKSEQWTGRIARWLLCGRLGDLGVYGDGWSNLIHVDDVCLAIESSLRLALESEALRTFNLAAVDSPRWNRYFVDFGLVLNATPVKRITRRQLKLDAFILSPFLKILEKMLFKLKLKSCMIPEPLPPSLLRFFSQDIRLDASKAKAELDFQTLPYNKGLVENVAWILETTNCGKVDRKK